MGLHFGGDNEEAPTIDTYINNKIDSLISGKIDTRTPTIKKPIVVDDNNDNINKIKNLSSVEIDVLITLSKTLTQNAFKNATLPNDNWETKGQKIKEYIKVLINKVFFNK